MSSSPTRQSPPLAQIYLESCSSLKIKPNSVLLQVFTQHENQEEPLKGIDISQNHIGPGGFTALLPVIQASTKTIETLNLSDNRLSLENVDALLHTLSSSSSSSSSSPSSSSTGGGACAKLRLLDLSRNPLTQPTKKSLIRFVSPLSSASSSSTAAASSVSPLKPGHELEIRLDQTLMTAAAIRSVQDHCVKKKLQKFEVEEQQNLDPEEQKRLQEQKQKQFTEYVKKEEVVDFLIRDFDDAVSPTKM